MKTFRINTGLIFASWALLLIFGCHKKKPQIPPEETPPTIISQIPTQPTEPPAANAPQPTPQQQADNTPQPEKPVHKPPKHAKAHPPTPKNQPSEPEKPPEPEEEAKNIPPPRVVVTEGGSNTGPGQATSSTTNDGNVPGQATTQQLLDSTENNLRNIKRQLSTDEQSMVSQIRDWIKQSKDATKDGDNVRAHNLALRARLLSDELAKTQ